MACRVVAFALFSLVVGSAACTVDTPAFGARCGSDVDCGAGLVCVVDVCVPGVAAGRDGGPEPDAGVDPDPDGGVDVDAGPDPVDAGPEPLVFNRAPRAFATTVVVAAGAVATVTLQGSDPDGDALTFSVESDPSVAGVTLDGTTATVTAAQADGVFKFTVSDGALSDTATVLVKLATPAEDGATTVYTGDNGGSWNDGGNWSIGVPGATVLRARVPAGKVVVVQGQPLNLVGLEVDNGAVIELGGFLLSATDARVGGEIRCTAAFCVRATTVAGRLPSWNASNSARLVGPTIVDGRVDTDDDFQIADQPLTAIDGLDVGGSLIQSGSLLHVEGSVRMNGNVVVSGGLWSLRGTFVRQNGSVNSTGTHRLILDGAASQSFTFGEGGCFNDIDVQTPALSFDAATRVCGRFTVRGGAGVAGASRLDVAGPFVLEDGGRIEVAELLPRNTVQVAGDGFAVPTVRIQAGLTMPVLPYQDLLVAGTGDVTVAEDVTVAGALRSVPGDTVVLVMGERRLDVGTMALSAPARISMVFPTARVVVAGDAAIGTNNGTTMSNGVIDVGAGLRFDNTVNTRYGEQDHTWRLTGTGSVTSALGTALVGRFEVAEGAVVTIGDGSTPLIFEPTRGLAVNGALTVAAGTTLRLLTGTDVTCGPGGSVTINGACSLNDQPCAPICP